MLLRGSEDAKHRFASQSAVGSPGYWSSPESSSSSSDLVFFLRAFSALSAFRTLCPFSTLSPLSASLLSSSSWQLARASPGRRRKMVPWKDSSSNVARPFPSVVWNRLERTFFRVTGKLESTPPLKVESESVALDC